MVPFQGGYKPRPDHPAVRPADGNWQRAGLLPGSQTLRELGGGGPAPIDASVSRMVEQWRG